MPDAIDLANLDLGRGFCLQHLKQLPDTYIERLPLIDWLEHNRYIPKEVSKEHYGFFDRLLGVPADLLGCWRIKEKYVPKGSDVQQRQDWPQLFLLVYQPF